MSSEPFPIDRAIIGNRVRRIRQQMRLSVRDLAAMAGLSKMSIVALEQGKNFRPATLAKVAEAMGLHTDRLVRPAPEEAVPYVVHKRGDDQWYDLTQFEKGPYHAGDLSPAEIVQLHEQGCSIPLNILASRLERGRIKATIIALTAESEARAHQGEEFVYVLSGSARITIGERVVNLIEGESIAFWSGEPHSYGPSEPPAPLATILSIRVDG